MAVAWTADLDTGIEPIDVQHRRLIDYINQLDVAAATADRDAVRFVLEQLMHYAISHFAFEEQLQADAGYAFAQAHKGMHDVFLTRVGRYRQRFDGGEDVAGELQRMLKAWLLHHIKRDDKTYATQLHTQLKRLVEDKHEKGWLARNLNMFFGRHGSF